MATLTAYRGLQVVTPDPTGDGGLAIQNDFKSLVDWHPKSIWAGTSDPVATDDQTADFYPGSFWLRTDVSPPSLFVCQSSATAAAVWNQVLLQVVQDAAPQLGADIDVNGHKIVSVANGDIIVQPNGTGRIVLVPTGAVPKVGIGISTPNSALQVDGPIATAVRTLTGTGNILADDSVVLCNATSAAFTTTLPTASGIAGRRYTIKRTNGGANNVTVATTSSQTIDGATTNVLGMQYAVLTVVSDGANWLIV